MFVKPCCVVEITSVSEDPTIAVSRLENEDIRFLRNVGTFLPLYVAFHRHETLVYQSRKCQPFELCSRSDQLKLRSVLQFLIWCTELIRRISREGIELRRWKGWRRELGRGGAGGLRRAQFYKGRRVVSLPLWILSGSVGANSAGQSLTRHVSVEGECVVARPWRISVSACLARPELRWRVC